MITQSIKKIKRHPANGDKFHREHVPNKDDGTPSLTSSIPFLQATLFASLLEDSITQLRILSECNNELRILKTNTDMVHLRALKFHVKQHKDILARIDHKDLGSNQYKLNKLFGDRTFFSDVLEQAYQDMALKRCFSSLTASIKTIEDRDEYQIKLSEEEARNKTTTRELVRNLRQQRNHIKSIVYDTNLTVETLKYQVEDTELNSETRSRFVDNWQRARSEQHDRTIFDHESGPSDTIQYYQNRSDQEHRVHAEVELLVNIFINETLTKVENWMNKFDTDMELQDLKIAKLKNKLQDSIVRRGELEETFETHAVFVKNWVQFKTDRQAAIDYREKMTKSAFIVQAWWRGLLVRLQLGPYRPKRGKGKKGPLVKPKI